MQKNITSFPSSHSGNSRQFEQILRTLSHELRNPLNAIFGMSQILKKVEHLDLQVQKSIDVIYQSSRDVLPLLDYISNYLLADPMVQRKQEKIFNLLDMFENLVAKHYLDAKDKDNNLFLAYNKSVADSVSGHQEELQMVVSFLINNAIRFTESGDIFVEVSMKPIPNTERNMFRITVKDSGCGIGSDLLEHIFDLFVPEATLHKTCNPGLKLSISRQILSQLGGEIEIHSKPNLGTIVTIDIPLKAISTVKGNSAPKCLWDSYRDNMRILVIENDDRIGDVLKQYLDAKETHVVSATNAVTALKSGLMQRKPYHMVVMDHELLENHLDSIIDLLGTFPNHFTPFFVVLSEAAESKRLTLLANEAAVSVIQKPVMPSKFTKKIALDWCNYKNKHSKTGISSEFAISPKVLLVEDNQNNIAVEKMMLESLGCQVDVALNGDEALECVRNHNNFYHLVFLDIGLPGKLGYEVAPLLRDLAVNGNDLPIVAMTAYVSDSDKAKCFRAGIIDIVAKPATIEKLETTIKQHVPSA